MTLNVVTEALRRTQALAFARFKHLRGPGVKVSGTPVSASQDREAILVGRALSGRGERKGRNCR